MKTPPVILLFLVLALSRLTGIDPFYLKMFESGKELFQQKRYAEAAENFRVAEFGLMAEKNILRELYSLQALALFKTSRGDEAKIVLEKLRRELAVTDFSRFERPASVDRDLLELFYTLKLVERPVETPIKKKGKEPKPNPSIEEKKRPQPTEPKPSVAEKKQPQQSSPVPVHNSPVSERSFDDQFAEIHLMLLNNQLREAQERLKTIPARWSKDGRTIFLEGLFRFRKGNDRVAVSHLAPLLDDNRFNQTIREELFYNLALAYYRLGEYGRFLRLHRLGSEKTRKQLQDVYDKVQQDRDREFLLLDGKFSRTGCKRLCARFAGDSLLGYDLLRFLLQNYGDRPENILVFIDMCAKEPECYEDKFILLAVSFLRNHAKEAVAARLIESSYIRKEKTDRSIPVLLELEEIYFNQKDYIHSRDVIQYLQAFARNHPEVSKRLERIKNVL